MKTKDYYLYGRVRWLKCPLLCLLISPLSVAATNGLEVEEEIFSVAYKTIGKANEKPELLSPFWQKKDTRILKGSVVDATNDAPIVGVNVVIKGTRIGVTTNADGNFSIEIDEKGATLEFSHIGYKKETVFITDQGVVKVKMRSDDQLDEVVVVGAGTQKKISVTGAILSIEGSQLSAPSSSLTANLAGKLAGVVSRTTSGEPGASSEFYIRGVGTFGGRATPLILLDGVEIASGDLNRVPAESIESFSILKDASATAIYGARGANGVMLVTTKNGVENQQAKINVTLENSFQQSVKQMDFADGATWMEAYNTALIARTPGAQPRFSDEAIELTRNQTAPYRYPDVDWNDILFKDVIMNQRANVNISGGVSRATYYMSLQYNHDAGMLDVPQVYSFDNNINRKNFNFQNNIAYSLSSTSKLSLRMNAQLGNLLGPGYSVGDLFNAAYDINPIVFPATYPAQENDRHIRFGNANLSGSTLYRNPYAHMLSSFRENNYSTMNTSLTLDQKLGFITNGLSFRVLVNLKSWDEVSYTRSIDPFYYRIKDDSWNVEDPNVFQLERVGASGNNFVVQSDPSRNSDQTIYLDARMDYNRVFGLHALTGMVMYMQREFRQGVLPNRNQGLSGRLTYGYNNRYLAEFNFGYNGTERLQKGDRFEIFPAVSAGWVASSEKFWEPISKYISHFKIRGSYGLVGSDNTGEGDGASHFLYIDRITLASGGRFITGASGGNVDLRGPGFQQYAVQDATWERVKKLNIGIDLDLFNQVKIAADYFRDHRDRILLRRGAWPLIMGYSSAVPWSNIGEVENKGFDMSLSWKKELMKDLNVDVRGSFTYNKNKYITLDEPAYPYVWQTRTGKPLNVSEGYIAEGLFESQEEINNSPVQNLGSTPLPGDIRYRDVNGDGLINNDDKVVLSPYGRQPRIQYGLGVNVTYKKFDFGVFFTGSGKRTIMIDNLAPFRSGASNGDRNLMQFIADDFWSTDNPNPNAAYPRLGVSSDQVANNMVASSFWMRDGRFIRFKTLECGYTFPHCRVYLSGDNLAVWSPFKLWDPELSWNSYPLSRTFNVGVRVNF